MMTRGLLLWALVVGAGAGCATLHAIDGRPRLVVPRTCPDGAPVRFLQDPSCGRDCGYSCLPDRWRMPPG